ncbi:MAG TPA: fimbrial protein [Rhodanobacteraceae bacterium]
MSTIRKLGHTLISYTLHARSLPLGILAAGTYLLLAATPASAACIGNAQPAGSVTFSPPATINLPVNVSPGVVLWQGTPQTPGNPVTLNYCDNNTQTGLENAKWGPPVGTDQTLFPTNYPWLSYRILHPDESTELKSWPNYPVSAPNGTIFNVESTLQLVVTGTIPSGSHNLAGGQLTQWDVDTGGGTKQTVEIFNITTSTITLVPPTCMITTDPTVVTLPPVTANAFAGGQGSTAGQTPFSIHLACQAYNKNLIITLNTADRDGGRAQGLITNQGSANYVDVQVLQGPACTTPVYWSNNISHGINEGQPQGGAFDLPFCAQYYQTSNNNVTAGSVQATATYTLSYQ